MVVLRLTPRWVLLASLIIPQAFAEDGTMQTDWLELVKGYKGSTMGAELISIEDDEKPDMQKIMLAIPKDAVGDKEEIEEVVVVGKMPEKPEPLDITYEWLDDYDNDNYGLVIRLSKDSNWPIRLYLNSNPGFVR